MRADSADSARHRKDRRTALDYSLAGVSTVLIVADWSQTLKIARYGGTDANSIIGTHPTEGRVNTWFTLAVAANGAALFLPGRPRRIWYSVVIAEEFYAVLHNLHMGWQIGF